MTSSKLVNVCSSMESMVSAMNRSPLYTGIPMPTLGRSLIPSSSPRRIRPNAHEMKAMSEMTWMATSAVGKLAEPGKVHEVQPRCEDTSGDGPDDHRNDETPAERSDPRVRARADALKLVELVHSGLESLLVL
jgi:hypothetical protein